MTWFGGLGVILGLATSATNAAADTTTTTTTAGAAEHRDEPPKKKLEWNYKRFSAAEFIGTGVVLGGAVATSMFRPRDNTANWRGGVFVDDAAAGFARSDSEAGRARIAGISDMFLYGMVALPYLDAGFVAGVRRSPDVAMQMALINTEAFAITGLTTQIIKLFARRERPWVSHCSAADPNDKSCTGSDSFLSGHTSMTFTAAGLMCAHHQALSIYGNPYADGAACAAALGMATATGFMRMAADKHYASDVFAGAALGLASGYLMPKLLHYGGFGGSSSLSDKTASKKSTKKVMWSAAPVPTQNGAMLSVSGIFF